MASLLSCLGISKAFGSRPLFQQFTLHLADGDRLGLIGRNGSGKSTLLQILAGLEEPDSGEVVRRKGLRVGYVEQESHFAPGETVWSVLEAGVAPLKLEELERDRRLHVLVGRVGFDDPHAEARLLSGGWQKRLSIAAQLVAKPDLLLLDEPTNHLDTEGIEWLESFLAAEAASYVVVSHDRLFLENVAREMAELGRNFPDGIFRAPGSYSVFLEKREEFLRAQSAYEESLANRVRTELEWLRRGPKARATKAKARIDNAYRLMDELETTRTLNRGGGATIDFEATDRQTKRLLEARKISKRYGDRVLFQEMSFLLGPGMRLGLVGANGSGKTTLLRILLGLEQADSGEIRQADFLKPVYFDQRREQLDPSHSLRQALGAHEDLILYRGKSIHVAAWAQRFLFEKEQLQSPVGSLSGGEHARLLIARLMLEPADLLLLDEPTNDLDIPTLEVLEESLLEFPGALVLITHDRFLMDRVATQVLGFFGNGDWAMFADYWQWKEEVRSRGATAKEAEGRGGVTSTEGRANASPQPTDHGGAAAPRRAQKLSYKEQREWEGMEARIHEIEERLAEAEAQLSDPVVVSDAAMVTSLLEQQRALQAEIEQLYARWSELEEKQAPRVPG
jgi:ABC transport system ATP-binding/permease protein